MLNIEGSLQKEMKRAFGMGDLLTNTNAIREASLEYQMTGDITEFNKKQHLKNIFERRRFRR